MSQRSFNSLSQKQAGIGLLAGVGVAGVLVASVFACGDEQSNGTTPSATVAATTAAMPSAKPSVPASSVAPSSPASSAPGTPSVVASMMPSLKPSTMPSVSMAPMLSASTTPSAAPSVAPSGTVKPMTSSTATPMPSSTGGGSGGAFKLTITGIDKSDNADCTPSASGANQDKCPTYPVVNTGLKPDGKNESPEMTWTAVPDAKSYVIVLHDLTASANYHWAIWDIPAGTTKLAAKLPKTIVEPAGAIQNDAFMTGAYYGSGKCGNVYEHRVYALSVDKLGLAAGATPKAVHDKITKEITLAESFVNMQSRLYDAPNICTK